MKALFFVIVGLSMVGVCLGAGGDMGFGTEALTDGSADHPYLIEDLADFDVFAGTPAYWASGIHTRLACDPNLAGRTYARAVIAPDNYFNSPPSVFEGIPYEGIFDGDGHTISNLTIRATDVYEQYFGLFGKIEGEDAEVKNLGIVNCSIIGNISPPFSDYLFYFGGLCGSNGSTITNCYSTGSVTGGDHARYVGGLCGLNLGTITNSHATGSVDGRKHFGGLCGMNSGTITNCYATSSVGEYSPSMGYLIEEAGGLCGWNDGTITNCYSGGLVTTPYHSEEFGGLCGLNDGIITNSYSTSSVSGDNFLGGLCGQNNSTISNCYSTGSVDGVAGSYYLGGLCGWNNSGTISNSYSTGTVTGDDYLGGLCGYQSGVDAEISNCFWDVQTYGLGASGDYNFGATGKTTAEMQTKSTFTSAGWDFVNETDNGIEDIWRLCVNLTQYPTLNWENPIGDFACPDGISTEDLLYFASYWLDDTLSAYEGGDLTGEGNENLTDFAIFAHNWLLGTSP